MLMLVPNTYYIGIVNEKRTGIFAHLKTILIVEIDLSTHELITQIKPKKLGNNIVAHLSWAIF